MIEVFNHHPRLRFPKWETQRTIQRVFRKESGKLLSVSVVFVDSRHIRRINRTFLGHDYVTDVISFPLAGGPGHDAELYVNLDRARSQAKEYGVSFTEEVQRLLIHGALHLAGYDDRKKKNKESMRRREDFYLARLMNKG
ncbi:MAG: rRNA maturation RNase YbeY [Bacteroidota bacterium]